MANAGSRRSVKAASEREQIDMRTAIADLQAIMSTPRGRSFVMRLLLSTRVDDVPMYVSNAMDLARDNGMRTIGLALLSDIREHCPEQEFVMRSEQVERDRRAALAEEAENGN